MKQYLLDTFHFNDLANRKMLEKIKALPEKDLCIKYFSHLINSQIKWMARITNAPGSSGMSWWEPIYPLNQLEHEWEKSLAPWLAFIQAREEAELSKEVVFVGYDGSKWAATPLDIALQLNYHSIHHRAQMQIVIREQGVVPDFIDYIGTKYRRLDG